MTPLKLGRRQAVSTGMTTSGVIEHFNVVEDIAAGSLPGGIGFTADALMRSKISHGYDGVQYDIVLAVIKQDMPALRGKLVTALAEL